MLTVFNILFPIVSIILIGYFIGRAKLFKDDFFSGVNKLVYSFGLAPMLFTKSATMTVDITVAMRSIGTIVLLITLLVVISWIIGTILKLPPKMKGPFVHGSMRGNYAYIGLPVVFYAFALTEFADSSTEVAILIITPAILYHNILAITIMLHYKEEKTGSGYLFILKSLSRDPLIMGCVLGLIFNIAGLTLPMALVRTGESLGKMALPLALIGIGATIDPKLLRGAVFPPLIASFIKTVASPLIMAALLTLFGIDLHGLHGKILLLLSACSVGVSTYIITEQYGGDGKLAGSAVFISAIMSMVSLSLVLLVIN